MRIYKNHRRRYSRLIALFWLLPMISACVNFQQIANQKSGRILTYRDDQSDVDIESMINASGIAILANDIDLVSEELPYQQDPLTIDMFMNKGSAAQVYVNEESVAVNWEEEEDYEHAQLLLAQEGTFAITVQVTNALEVQWQIQTLPIKMDVAEPQIQAYLDGKAVSELPDYLDHEAVLKWEVRDAFFDPQSSIITDCEKPQSIIWKQHDAHWEAEITLRAGTHSLTVSGADIAGHRCMWMGKSIVDVKRPVVKLEYEPQSTYREPFTAAFLIEDENMSVDDDMVSLICDGEIQPITIDWRLEKHGSRGNLKVENNGRCSLSFHISDQAGHTAVYETINGAQEFFQHNFLLDQTSPQLVFEAGDAMVNQPQKVVLRIMDEHLDQSAIHTEVMRDEMVVENPFTWEKQAEGWLGKAYFSQDGHYRLQIEAADQVGNKLCHKDTCGQIVHEFTLDQQSPTLHLNHSKGSFYRKERTEVTFTVSDRNLAAYQLLVMRDQIITAVKTGKNNDTLTLTLDQDGSYEIIGTAQDEVGNVSQIKDQFIVDQQPPQLQVYFNEMPAQNAQTFISNRNVVLHMAWQDPYLETKQIRVLKNKVEIPVKMEAQTMTLSLSALQDREDTYEIMVFLRDLAGNETKGNYQLRMDTYLPSLKFVDDPFQGKARNISWQPRLQEEDLAFHVSDVILYRNQQLVKDFHWGDTISAEGQYLLTLSVRDEAMNEATLLPPFAFTIDHTPPTYRILEAQRKAELLDRNVSVDSELCLYLQDAFSKEVSIHTLTLDGHSLEITQREQDENGEWYYPLRFHEAGDVSLQIHISDEAGNHTMKTIVFHVSDQMKQSDVKTVESTVPMMEMKQENDIPPAVIVCGIVVSVLFARWIKKTYATK